MTALSQNLFLSLGTPIPVCQRLSMIDSRLRNRPSTFNYPSLESEKAALSEILRFYRRYQRLLSLVRSSIETFQPLNFLEYVLKSQLEFISGS